MLTKQRKLITPQVIDQVLNVQLGDIELGAQKFRELRRHVDDRLQVVVDIHGSAPRRDMCRPNVVAQVTDIRDALSHKQSRHAHKFCYFDTFCGSMVKIILSPLYNLCS